MHAVMHRSRLLYKQLYERLWWWTVDPTSTPMGRPRPSCNYKVIAMFLGFWFSVLLLCILPFFFGFHSGFGVHFGSVPAWWLCGYKGLEGRFHGFP